MYLVDSHCHLDLLDSSLPGNDRHSIIARAEKAGLIYMLNVSVSLADFETVLKTAEEHAFVGASLGSHPNEKNDTITLSTLLKLGAHPKVVAIGETGLDYFRSTGDLTWQRDRFRTHIEAAKILQKPLIVHTREAKTDTIQIMRKERVEECKGVMHCFTEDWATAKQALDMNFYISFSGIVTFKSATALQEVARKVPLDRILIETDSPYLAPNPHRGKPNEPAYVRLVALFLAELRGIAPEQLAEQTTENFFTLFKGAIRPHV